MNIPTDGDPSELGGLYGKAKVPIKEHFCESSPFLFSGQGQDVPKLDGFYIVWPFEQTAGPGFDFRFQVGVR